MKELEFLKDAISLIEKIRGKNLILAESFENMFVGNSAPCLFDDIETGIIEATEKMLGDKYKYIDWWIYEKDLGRNDDIKVYDKDDKELPSETVDDLYNLIKGK